MADEESKGEPAPARSKISYYKTVQKESNTVFILKHESDEALDMRVELYQDAETVEFDGLPNELQFDMETTFKLEDRRKFPETCLFLLLQTK